ncbi:MAG: DUF5665 domain-containing protein [Candidatus Margulisiibacteriota bacterium]
MNDEDRLVEALEKIRRDKHQPWHYVLFTFINGIAWGLGMALGMTVILAIVVYFLFIILRHLINFPLIGQYINDLIKILDAYLKQGGKIR